jgi:glycosyltransferase involved in cell wall biosynthesis
MNNITLVIPYYNHEDMFKRHIEYWSKWSSKIAKQWEVIVVDDGSKLRPLKITDKIPLKITAYRVLDDISWNVSGADNLAFSVATTPWVFRSDMDLVMTSKLSRLLYEMKKEPDKLYFPWRTKTAVSDVRRDPHCNSFLINRAKFWEIGGYNEDFSGSWGYADAMFLFLAHNVHGMTDVRLDVKCPLIYFTGGGSGVRRSRGTFNHTQLMHRVDNKIYHNGPILRFKWEKIYEN